MKLSDVKEILKKPINSALIAKGKLYESRLRMYTEPLDKDYLHKEPAWDAFDKFMATVLSEKKHKRVSDFIRYPLNSVDIAESTLTDIYKVFDASNSYFGYETGTENEENFQQTINDIDIVNFIKKNGKIVLKNKPNTFVVLDRNEEGEEYFLTIENNRLYDCGFCEDNKVDYIAFTHSYGLNEKGEKVEFIAFYCDEYYRVFLKTEDDFLLVEGKEIEHKLGECPARMFISDEVSCNDPFNKRIPLTSVLSKLEEWQIFDIYQFYVNHYGPFPIIERAEENCSIEGCVSGFIPKTEEYFEDEVRRSRTIFNKCPSCADKSLIGPGTVVNIPSKLDKDTPDGAGILRMITPSIENLKYINERQNSLEDYIYLKTVGANTLLDNEAVNKLQVKGSFETKKGILMKLKPNFDNLYKWMVEILYKSQKGADAEILVFSDFGTEFHLVTEDEIQSRYSKAKTSGMPDVEVDTIYLQLIDTKYRTNPELSERMWLIKTLDPLPHDTFDQKSAKFTAGLITEVEYHISSRILSFVERFEIENTNLVVFGKSLPLREKLSKINEQFKIYANEYITAKQVIVSTKEGADVGGSGNPK